MSFASLVCVFRQAVPKPRIATDADDSSIGDESHGGRGRWSLDLHGPTQG